MSAGPTEEQTISKATKGRGRNRLRNLGLQLLVLVLLIALWYFAAANEWVTPLLLPEPLNVLESLQSGLLESNDNGGWWGDIGVTLTETGLGFVIGSLLGLVVGALFAFVKILRTAFYPYVIALMSLPKIAIAPLLIVAFGYDLTPKVIIATMLAFFPVMTAATAGLSAVDPDELNLMRAMQASRWQELRYLRLPNAMSYVFPSFDVALIGALLGAVAAELVGAQSGLGYLLSQGQAYGDVAGMYGLLIVLAALGALLHVLIAVVQKVLPESVVPKPREESR
ncbi:ABC transporter permease [Cumulibacter soli]|uniref:ABC transporter permease n=1 Tax=Cumulibacter soli TaxID=2546344 RepID=UPI0010674993|nr:ABC transporter permease [Cumulibacter soli]